ncbi:MAG: hypothetical protein ACOXZN_01470 [Minisyncoccales bacterium]|jgi:hypothetical protein
MKITRKTKLKEIIDNEKLRTILEEFGFPCLFCPYMKAEIETLEIGYVCDNYGIDDKKLIKKLNE